MSDAKKDLLLLPISGPRGASSRYRLFQYLPALDAAGISYTIHTPSPPRHGVARILDSQREQISTLKLAKNCKATFIQKRLLSESLVDRLSASGPIIFDFDDAIFTSPDGHRSWIARRRVNARLQHTLATSKLVIAGNFYLADYARQYASNVVEIPTVIDTERYPARPHLDAREMVIGWIGHSVNHPYLLALADALQSLAAKTRFRLLIVSDRDLVLPGIDVENRRWSESSEVQDILAMDIGIMPMPDDPWSRGKCGLKALQYMAAGIPVVCAPVGVNAEIITAGQNGFTASSASEWTLNLEHLCASTKLRAALGGRARENVESDYSLHGAAPRMVSLIGKLLR